MELNNYGQSLKLVLVFALVLAVAGSSIAFGQGKHTMTSREYNKFRIAKSHHYAGQQSFIRKKYMKAEKSFLKCLESYPKYSSADYFLGKINNHNKMYVKALKHIERAKLNYKHMNDLNISAQLEYFDALRQKKENLQKDLSNPELVTRNRDTMQREILTIDTKLQQKPLAQVNHAPAEYYFMHGNIFFRMKKLKEAHDQYVEAIRLGPQFPDTYNNLINLYFMVQKFDRAYEYIKKAEKQKVKVNPKLKAAILKVVKKK